MNYKHLVLVLVILIGFLAVPVSAVTASFIASPTSGMAPLNVFFEDQSTGAVRWRWDFGDGNVILISGGGSGSISHTYNSGGTFSATLTVNDVASRSRTILVTAPTTIPTTIQTTVPTTEPTTIPTTVPTTEVTTQATTEVPTTNPTTEATTEIPTTVPTTEITTTIPTTVPTTEITTEIPTTEPTEQPSQQGETTVPTLITTKETPTPEETPTEEVTLAPPLPDNTREIVLPWMPVIDNKPFELKFQFMGMNYIIRRGK